jgi:hypothetical protein
LSRVKQVNKDGYAVKLRAQMKAAKDGESPRSAARSTPEATKKGT